MLCGIDHILGNIPHIQFACERSIPHNIVNMIVYNLDIEKIEGAVNLKYGSNFYTRHLDYLKCWIWRIKELKLNLLQN